jgi:hypothetical protein
MAKHNFKVCYDVKNVEKGNGIYNLIVTKKSYFETLQEAFTFSKEIYGMRKNGVEVVGRPSIERM